jgi:DNA-binding transcriptional ArsR family regulator
MTNAPTRELRGHVEDVEDPRVDERAFRQGWRIRTRLDQLLVDQRISAGEWQAATEFRSAWLSARELTARESGGSGIRIAGGRTTDAATIARLEAAKRVRIVEITLGKLAIALVVACVVEDLSWAAIGRHLHRDAETVRDWTVVAIGALSRVWGFATWRHDAGTTARRRDQDRTA